MRLEHGLLGWALLAATASACSTPIAHFRVLSKDKMPESRGLASTSLQGATGKSCWFFNNYVLFFHFSLSPDTIDGAITEARQKHPEIRRLVDFNLEKNSLTTLFVNQYCYKIWGMADSAK